MKNFDVIKQIITGNSIYYLASIKNDWLDGAYYSIWLICVPEEIIEQDWLELKVSDYERFSEIEINKNIPLNDPDAPFQEGFKLSDFHNAFPIDTQIHEFVKQALNMEPSRDIWKYKELLASITKEEA